MSGRTIVLMYHRIADEPHDPFALAVGPKVFDDQLALVRRRAEIVPLTAVLERGRGPRVAITLDDGYSDNAHAALDVLSAHAAPATFFVVSDAVGSGTSLWQLRLEHVFRRVPRAEAVTFTAGGRTIGADVRSLESRAHAMRFAHTHLRPRPIGEIESALDELASQFQPGVADDRRMLSEEEIRILAGHPLATIGAHTRTHPWLATLDEREQLEELDGSRARLEAMSGTRVDLLAYPYGRHDAFNRATVRAARLAGFRLACTTRQAPVLRMSSRYRVPRYAVVDGAQETFEQRLDRWLNE